MLNLSCVMPGNCSVFQACMALNDLDAAVESFKKALELEPNDGRWLFEFFVFTNLLMVGRVEK